VIILIADVVFVLGLLWLGWRAWTWWRSGSVVEVRAGYVWPGDGQAVGERLIQVSAHNAGRSSVEITSWGLATPDGGLIASIERVAPADPLPYVLTGGRDAHWFVRAAEVEWTRAQRGQGIEQLRARVVLSNGRTVWARRKGIDTPP
jgi:hypothetical protein